MKEKYTGEVIKSKKRLKTLKAALVGIAIGAGLGVAADKHIDNKNLEESKMILANLQSEKLDNEQQIKSIRLYKENGLDLLDLNFNYNLDEIRIYTYKLNETETEQIKTFYNETLDKNTLEQREKTEVFPQAYVNESGSTKNKINIYNTLIDIVDNGTLINETILIKGQSIEVNYDENGLEK